MKVIEKKMISFVRANHSPKINPSPWVSIFWYSCSGGEIFDAAEGAGEPQAGPGGHPEQSQGKDNSSLFPFNPLIDSDKPSNSGSNFECPTKSVFSIWKVYLWTLNEWTVYKVHSLFIHLFVTIKLC